MHHDDIQRGHETPHHGHSLAEDIAVIETLFARRRALKWFAGAGTVALVAGCGGSSADSDAVTTVTTTTATPTSTTTATPTPTTTTTSTGCIVDPTETAGPYPADGTNTASGSTSNALTVSGIVRSDIRASFISTTTVATGTQLTITLTVVDVNATCAPLANYAVYLWQCDRNGNYSLYTAPTESYLRGVQVTNAAGQVTFTTIVPGCYDGRYPHMHFEVFSTLTAATGGRYAVLTSQLAMPAALCNAVYADTTLYPSSATRFANISTSSDGVFSDNTAAQIAQQTPTFSGSVADGYTANVLIGVAR
ncbi:intradiol ring-cleavage dioxygenase [Sphingomonas sp. 4RDLI-65]|uniref:dioxygenase family protein n=1 Tax=Sphingomonas sp. 4RDLI-65 TaxID=3111641 RepID=UPI003C2A30EA